MSLNRNIRETYSKANEVMEEIDYETNLLNQLMSSIPKNKAEGLKLQQNFEQLKPRIEPVYQKFLDTKNELELFVRNASNPNQRKDIMLKHSNLLRIWEHYYARRADCSKFTNQAFAFYNMNEGVSISSLP